MINEFVYYDRHLLMNTNGTFSIQERLLAEVEKALRMYDW